MTRIEQALRISEMLGLCSHDWSIVTFDFFHTEVEIDPCRYILPVWVEGENIRIGGTQELAILSQSSANIHHSCDSYGKPSASIAFCVFFFLGSGISLSARSCPIPETRKAMDAHT